MTAHGCIANFSVFSRTLGGGWHNFDAKIDIFQVQEVQRFRPSQEEVAEDRLCPRVNQDEVVGYIAIESGSATLQSTTGSQVKMAAVVSGRSVRGWKNGKYDVALGTDLSASAPLAVASQCTHYGGDGGWARLRGTDRHKRDGFAGISEALSETEIVIKTIFHANRTKPCVPFWMMKLVSILFSIQLLHAAGDQGLSGNCSTNEERGKTGGNAFIQYRSKSMLSNDFEVPVSWVAGPFGSCIRVCPGSRHGRAFGKNPAFQKREVNCYSLNAEQLEDFRCEHLMKPRKYRRCHCGVLSCPKDCSDCQDDESSDNSEFGESRDSEFELVGCFPLGDGDVTGETEEAADFKCRDWTDNSAACRSGLPFYRLQMNHDMTPELCFEFCIGAGLDLFGLVGEECRCGASLLNKDIWRMEAPRTTGLLLPLAKQLPESEMECPVRVYRWLGPFVSGGSVPEHLQMLHVGNTIYVDSIVTGTDISEEQEEDGQIPIELLQKFDAESEEIQKERAASGIEDPRWDRPCDDFDGCQAARPWIERTTVAPEGMLSQWQEYVMVRYKFDADVDNTRKEAFRAAAADWRTHTCIAVVEDDNAET
eukprot:s7_g44.t1